MRRLLPVLLLPALCCTATAATSPPPRPRTADLQEITIDALHEAYLQHRLTVREAVDGVHVPPLGDLPQDVDAHLLRLRCGGGTSARHFSVPASSSSRRPGASSSSTTSPTTSVARATSSVAPRPAARTPTATAGAASQLGTTRFTVYSAAASLARLAELGIRDRVHFLGPYSQVDAPRILGDAPRERVRFGHTSGTLAVGAEAVLKDGEWVVTKAVMSRSARRLMEGAVYVPA